MDEKILKADVVLDKVVGSTPKVLKREVYEASREARDVVTQAQEKAKQIVEEAMRERDRIREQGREEGNAEGLAAWNDILIRSRRRSDELTKNWEEAMLQLSVHIARKIIGEELKQNPETILAIVREVIKGTRTGKNLAIQVNDSEAQYVRAQVDRLRQFLGGGSDIEIVPSSAIPVGGCVIESELGIIDARLDTQLKCLEDALIRNSSSD
jgi:type III secretion system HrpE/YscL family protein